MLPRLAGRMFGGEENDSSSMRTRMRMRIAEPYPFSEETMRLHPPPPSYGSTTNTNTNTTAATPLLTSSRDEDEERREEEDDEDEDHVIEEEEETEPALVEEEEEEEEGEEQEEEAIAVLTRRLRCLFAIITWPIVPLGTLVTLALLWLLSAAFVLDARESCGAHHPLHWYAVGSLLLVAYIPYHAKVRSLLFHYVRERDGYNRPIAVRRYDQCFHTLALLYVYGGITLVQTCRDDFLVPVLVPDHDHTQPSSSSPSSHIHTASGATTTTTATTTPGSTGMNTCEATCPHLYQALSVYVATVELFTFSLILPLLFLPCIYLWFLRQATADAEALAVLQDRLREEEFLFRNGGVTTNQIFEQLEAVKLVSIVVVPTTSTTTTKGVMMQGDDNNDGTDGATTTTTTTTTTSSTRVLVVPVDSCDLSQAKDANGVKSCCICMSDFRVIDSTSTAICTTIQDIETGQGGGGGASSLTMDLPPGAVQDDTHTTNTSSGNDNNNDGNHGENNNNDNNSEAIVRTLSCGHLFHKHCIESWVGGRWQTITPNNHTNTDSSSPSSSPRRRARRTTCPLCRNDLRHSSR